MQQFSHWTLVTPKEAKLLRQSSTQSGVLSLVGGTSPRFAGDYLHKKYKVRLHYVSNCLRLVLHPLATGDIFNGYQQSSSS